jgi:hypothetical protein
MVPRGLRDGSLRPYSRFSRQVPLLFYQVAPQLYSRGWVDPVPDPLLFSFFFFTENLVVPGIEPGPPDLLPRTLTTRPQRRSICTFITVYSPDRIWGPPNLLSNDYQGLFLRGYSGLGVKLTTHLQPVPRSRMVELYLNSHIRFHGVMPNYVCTGASYLLRQQANNSLWQKFKPTSFKERLALLNYSNNRSEMKAK